MDITLENIRDLIAIITLPLILYRIWIIKSSFSQDHERSRNQKAVELIKDWTRILNHKSSAARIIVEQLSRQECIKLQKQEVVTIENNEKNRNLLKVIYEEEFQDDKKPISLDTSKSSKLRWEIVTYLNILESVLIAYRHNVADRRIIKEQFQYLVNPTENQFILEEFRNALGQNDHPGIRDFAKELKEDKDEAKKGKSKTGFLGIKWGK